MTTNPNVGRRRFLSFAGGALPLFVFGCKKTRRATTATKPKRTAARRCAVDRLSGGPGRVLNGLEWTTIEAVCSRILPSDADPGAGEAGVVNYIDAQLQHPPIDAFSKMIRVGVRYITLLARRQGAPNFARLTPAKQDQLLRKLQRGRMGRYQGARFMRVLVALTLEGFLGDPLYGGNRDQVGWKMIGFIPQSPGPHCPYTGSL